VTCDSVVNTYAYKFRLFRRERFIKGVLADYNNGWHVYCLDDFSALIVSTKRIQSKVEDSIDNALCHSRL
jgi:hypothetical protein